MEFKYVGRVEVNPSSSVTLPSSYFQNIGVHLLVGQRTQRNFVTPVFSGYIGYGDTKISLGSISPEATVSVTTDGANITVTNNDAVFDNKVLIWSLIA